MQTRQPARKPGKITSHKDLIVWNAAMDLVVEVYALCRHLPRTEEYRMIAQMTRSAVSIPANIAEDYARYTRKDYAHFVTIAKGSHAELETYLELVVRLNFMSADRMHGINQLSSEVGRMLTSLRKTLTEERKPPISDLEI